VESVVVAPKIISKCTTSCPRKILNLKSFPSGFAVTLKLRTYSQQWREDWLSLMTRVQCNSAAWEALYLEHPDFDPECDYGLFEHEQLVGICAGWRMPAEGISLSDSPAYSIEILAIDPACQRKGFGRKLLEMCFAAMQPITALHFWTSDPQASLFYEKLGLVAERRFTRVDSPFVPCQGGFQQNWNLQDAENGEIREFVYKAHG